MPVSFPLQRIGFYVGKILVSFSLTLAEKAEKHNIPWDIPVSQGQNL